MFDKKPTVFDKRQDKQLQQLMANQRVLVPNNNYLIKQNAALWKWVKWLEAEVKALDSRLTMNERKDAERARLFEGLAVTSSNVEEVNQNG